MSDNEGFDVSDVGALAGISRRLARLSLLMERLQKLQTENGMAVQQIRDDVNVEKERVERMNNEIRIMMATIQVLQGSLIALSVATGPMTLGASTIAMGMAGATMIGAGLAMDYYYGSKLTGN